MFGISVGEIVVIFILGLLFLDSKDFLTIFRWAMKTKVQMERFFANLINDQIGENFFEQTKKSKVKLKKIIR